MSKRNNGAAPSGSVGQAAKQIIRHVRLNLLSFRPIMNKPLGFNLGDFWGSLSASAVVLPQSMAFGVALLATATGDAATGAMAGLVAAALLSLASGLARGTIGMVSAPTGPTFVLLAGALSAMAAKGLAGELLLAGMAILLVATGVLQALIGVTGGGKLIKFIPYPVVYGFITGSAILMVKSQLNPLQGGGMEGVGIPWIAIPAVTALVTFVAMQWLPKVLPAIPGSVSGLIFGTGVFHILLAVGPGAAPEVWVVGSLPEPDSLKLGISPAGLEGIPWGLIVSSALALAVLASIDALLTSVVADVQTGERHNARRELIGQGIGQAVSGLFGGMTGSGTTGATVVAISSGGRRWVGVTTGIVFILLILFMGPVGRWLPISALAGIILHVALVGMLKRDIIPWFRYRKTRMDGFMALLVIIVTVGWDLMIAVGVGVGLATLIFVREKIRMPVIHRRSTGAERPSLRARPLEQEQLLHEHGGRIILYELRGNLFFGTVDRLFGEMMSDLDKPNWVILDMRRVSRVDLTAIKMLQQMANRIVLRGGQLLFANVHKSTGLSREVAKTFSRVASANGLDVKSFIDSDEALEYAENELLVTLGVQAVDADCEVPFEEIQVFEHLGEADIVVLKESFTTLDVAKGERLFKIGDPGDTLYLVARGEVDAVLRYSKKHYRRLAKFGPGTSFGEITLLKPGPRTTEGRVMLDSRLYAIDRQQFERLVADHPAVAAGFLLAIGQKMGSHLADAADEIRRLSQW